MLNLGRLGDLSRALGIDFGFLHEVLDDFDTAPASLVKELTLWRADESKKPRDVICVRKRWRLIQERIYLKLLLPCFTPLKCCHGGVRRRSPATNARVHLGNRHALVADISNFFPSISCHRVNKLFLAKACSYEVARALTRLCTYDYHLALGLVTSPIIANEILIPVDEELERFCRRKDLVYSRFIDDMTISGNYDLQRCGAREVVQDILRRNGFQIANGKTAYGRLDVVPVGKRGAHSSEPLTVTGIRIKRSHVDPSKKYITELERIIDDHLSLAADGPFDGPLYVQSEVFGKAYYACSLNPGRRRTVLGKMKKINWWMVYANAVDRGLVRFRNCMTRRGDVRPDCSMPLPLAAGAKFVRDFYEVHDYDPAETPFDVPK